TTGVGSEHEIRKAGVATHNAGSRLDQESCAGVLSADASENWLRGLGHRNDRSRGAVRVLLRLLIRSLLIWGLWIGICVRLLRRRILPRQRAGRILRAWWILRRIRIRHRLLRNLVASRESLDHLALRGPERQGDHRDQQNHRNPFRAVGEAPTAGALVLALLF